MTTGAYEIYLIRHGLAEQRGDAWPDDTKRPLTERGVTKVRKTARALRRAGLELDIVLTSPLVRARQTADAFVAAFDPRPHIGVIESLAPGGAALAVVGDLAKHARKPRV